MNPFNIEEQFDAYMNTVQLGNLPKNTNQYIEMKRTWFASWGICLLFMRDTVGDLPEDTAILALDDQLIQVSKFIKTQV